MLRKLSDIIGQEPAIDALRTAWLADRLPHAMIFTGPDGVGKSTTARALATLFLCDAPKRDEPCGACPSCRAMGTSTKDAIHRESTSHPDFHVITRELARYHDKSGKSKATVISIEVVRAELVKPAAQKPAMGRGKVFLLEQADLTQPAAQNGMLKTLEEPDGRTLIILLSEQPEYLLPTIRSRCRLVQFGELDSKVVRAQLLKRGVSARDADRAVCISPGSIGSALRWLEDGVVDDAENLFARLIEFDGGKGDPNGLAEWFKSTTEAQGKLQLKRDRDTSESVARRDAGRLYLQFAGEHYRRLISRSTDNPEALERAADAIDAVRRAESMLDSNVYLPLAILQLGLALKRDPAVAAG